MTRPSRPPVWRDVRVLRWAFQLAVLAVVVAVVSVLVNNVISNSDKLGIPTGFDYLDNPSRFTITGTDFRQTQPVRDAIVIGLGNTIRLSLFGIVAATILGTLVGIARLSGNWLVRTLAGFYVETVRNIPLLLIVIFSYTGLALVVFPRIDEAWRPAGLAILSNRGVWLPWIVEGALVLGATLLVAGIGAWLVLRWQRDLADRLGRPSQGWRYALPLFAVVAVIGWVVGGVELSVPDLDGAAPSGGQRFTPELFAIAFALVLYTASHIAEIVRGSIQAVASGQGEAAWALALSPFQRMRDVVLPQAFRIALPPLGNQYLNLMKNSTLGAVVAYFELAKVTSISVGNAAPAVPSYLLTLVIYLALSLVISLAVNIVNRRLKLVEQ